MTTRAAKRRAVGEIEWVMDKLKTHALMATGRPVTNATLRLLPSAEQCTQLADRLGAALVELGHARVERGTRSEQRMDVPLTETTKLEAAPTIDERYGLETGSFAKFIAEEQDRERREEAERRRHIDSSSASAGTGGLSNAD